ncbi:hypothetical protein TRVL_09112 [Trypanosoma vivax]|nr:hypothetical protein TRVL_09112 [Trypanosoma vivax]
MFLCHLCEFYLIACALEPATLLAHMRLQHATSCPAQSRITLYFISFFYQESVFHVVSVGLRENGLSAVAVSTRAICAIPRKMPKPSVLATYKFVDRPPLQLANTGLWSLSESSCSSVHSGDVSRLPVKTATPVRPLILLSLHTDVYYTIRSFA